MASRWIACIGSLLLLCALASEAQEAYRKKFPLPDGTVPNGMGVNIHFNDPRPGEMEQLAGAGFKWIRQDFTWAAIEHVKGEYDFSAYDRLMGHLKKAGIRPIFILDYGNDLYQEGSPNTPESRTAFGRFAAAAVTHFKGQGVVWEMWNEPNIGFWKPKPNWDEYIALGLETGKAIRKAAPTEWFVGPGMSGMDFPFLERCLKAGLLNYWDAVSFHPYRDIAPETATADFHRVRELIAQYAPQGRVVPILSSEWGYSELYPGLNRERQSWYIARQTLTNLYNGLRISIWYDWHDDGTDAKEAEHHFGTVYNDYRPKETYQAAQTLSKTFNGFNYNKRLALNSPDDYCLLFERGKEVRLAVWTTSHTPHPVVIPSSAGGFRMISYLGEASEKTAMRDGLTVTLSEAPTYLMPIGENGLLELAGAWISLPPDIAYGDMESIGLLADLSGDLGVPRPSELRLQEAVGDDSGSTEFRTVLTMPEAHGKATPIPSGLKTLIDRGATPHRFRAVLTGKGMPPLMQETVLTAHDPIGLTALAPLGTRLPVQVTNVSGKPFKALLRVRVDAQNRTEAVEFKSGEKEKRIDVALPQPPNADATVRLTLQERYGTDSRPLVTAQVMRFQRLVSGEVDLVANTKVVPDGDAQIASQIELTQAPAPAGLPVADRQAGKVSYTFAPGWKFLRVAPQGRLQEPLKGEPDAIGMWVHSGGSHDLLRARFIDSTGQTFQPDGGTLDFRGWKYITIPLHPGGGHWGGANDDHVHYPIRLDTLLLIDTPDRNGAKGEVYFTDPMLIYKTDH